MKAHREKKLYIYTYKYTYRYIELRTYSSVMLIILSYFKEVRDT